MAAVPQSTQPSRKAPLTSPLDSLHEVASATTSSTTPASPATGSPPASTPVVPTAPPAHRHHHHQHHASSSSISSQRTGGFLALAAAALDKTLSGISEPRVRPRQSLSRLSAGPDFLLSSASQQFSPDRSSRARPASNYSVPSPPLLGESRLHSSSPSPRDEQFGKPYTETDPNYPQPVRVSRNDNKMHQTSSRLLRMTDDDRPFTKVSIRLGSLSAH
jgi:hypothetical protein